MARSPESIPKGASEPVLIVAFPAVGDFVRCHTLVRMVAALHPGQPIDIMTRVPSVELAQFMPEIREGLGETFKHRRLHLRARLAMAQQLRNRGYRTVYVIPTSYKAAVVPFLAGIPERIGWSDEFRFILINRLRFGLRRMDRILDEIGALGVPAGEDPPEQWPAPRLVVPPALQAEVEQIRATAASDRPVIAFAPGSAESRRMWPVAAFAELARRCQQRGWTVWVVGAGWEREIATQIGEGTGARDLTRTSVTSLALTLAAADVFVGNNSGPLHIAAGFGKPSIAVFGSPLAFFGAPINPGVRVVEAPFAAARMHRHHLRWPSVDAVDAALTEAVEALPAKAGESWSPAVVPL